MKKSELNFGLIDYRRGTKPHIQLGNCKKQWKKLEYSLNHYPCSLTR